MLIFTVEPFGGNPAPVCVLDSAWPSTDWLQQLAAELNQPSTTFVRRARRAELRWFSPHTGVLGARREPDGRITLDFPADDLRPVPVSPALTAALGAAPVAASRGRLDLIAELDSARTR